MTRAASFVLTTAVVGLVGCGSLGSGPAPLAGDLLSAPTALNFKGQLLRLEATPRLNGETFGVKVRLHTSRAPTPRVTPLNVYVVTGGGVWDAPYRRDPAPSCGQTACVSGLARGSGDGVQNGEAVQVVVQLKDERGRLFWLRDSYARVKR
ncbi:hypothetical protein DEDE109153_00945 [Deinococcus deserti]|uniref:Lipoprotein n=1 Tax=Deinococcus deserti (strain DSM 17065 / CIP 109153 / LMG 22923 / VCD115) TaxID=546414 RepID=C1CVP7_DEIDV|nr:hypothetical protein [Deinococcus deserti]ACO46264.1 conserved hypothetical protein, precursor [Deinococcus deserti VCD115]